mgnify:CR=1 FL=1
MNDENIIVDNVKTLYNFFENAGYFCLDGPRERFFKYYNGLKSKRAFSLKNALFSSMHKNRNTSRFFRALISCYCLRRFRNSFMSFLLKSRSAFLSSIIFFADRNVFNFSENIVILSFCHFVHFI